MMLILKLPILYLAGVCYWAIKAEPKPLEEARVTARVEPGPRGPSSRRPQRPSSHGGPRRREPRKARAARVRPPA